MSREKVRIRFDGPALAEHSIDIDDLVPALLAIGELCKLANHKFNGDRASVKVLVNADLEQNCFELNIELALTLLSQVKAILSDDVTTANDLLVWLGIIGVTTVPSLGLFKLLKLLKGRKIESSELQVQDGNNVSIIKIEGDNNHVCVYPQTSELLEDSRVIYNVQKIVKPLKNEGYEKLEFESFAGWKEEITEEDANNILTTNLNTQLALTEHEEPQVIITRIRVYSPIYKKDAINWKFEFGDKYETMDISETDIAENAIRRGGALVNDTYKVKLEITLETTQAGKFKNRYRIKEVIEFYPSNLNQQTDMFNINEP